MTLGRILVNDEDEGSGFALATMLGEPSRVALTAYHVIRDAEASSLRFVTEAGRTVTVKCVERDEDLDVAVLHLGEDVPEGLAVGHAVKGANWEVKTGPLPNDPQLNGTIDALRRRITNDRGNVVEVMQLQEKHLLDEYEGYSGSPVELESPPGAVIGVLSEQVRSRFSDYTLGSPRASNVLYAIPMEDVLERFRLTAAPAEPPAEVCPPNPPAHLVGREDELRLLRDDVLRDPAEQVTGGRRIALVGMGGSGKTVLAAQLARDPDIRRVFRQEVIWIELGKTPLVACQARLAAALGDKGQDFPDHVSAQAHLRGLLADRACLIVLDNVRHRDDLEAFDVLGPRGRLLFTTRDADLAESYTRDDGLVRHIGFLSSNQARTLLAEWAGLDADTLPPEAGEVLEKCGGLPLAIAMSGAMVQGHPERWPSLLRKFEKARIDRIARWLPGYDYPNLLVALDVGVEDLDTAYLERGLSDARDRYLDLAVFSGWGTVPESALAALWTSADVEDDEVEDYADLFAGRSLATWDTDERRLDLHDLQMDYVANRARGRLRELHARLVDGYARHCPAGWASGPDDGYFFQHLPHHLAQADRGDELRALLTDAMWIRAKLKAAGVVSLVTDYNLVPDELSLQLVGEGLRLSARALARDPDHLESQLLGRLADQDDPTVQRLLESAIQSRTDAWLRPLTCSLARPGGLLRRVLRLPSSPGVSTKIEGIAQSADGHVAVCQALRIWPGASEADSKVFVWDLHSLEEPRELRPPHPLGHLAVTSNGRLAAFAAGPWDLDLVDLQSGTVLDQTRTKLNPTAVAIADDPPRVVVGHLDGWVACWEPGGGSAHTVQAFPHEHVRAVAISADGSTAVAMSNYGSLVHLPLPEMRPAQAIGVHDGAFDLALSPDGHLAVTGGHDRSLALWDLEQGKPGGPTQVLPPQEARISAVSAIDGSRAVASLGDGTIQVWDLSNGQMLASAELDRSIRDLAVSRDGRTAIAREGKERVLVLDLAALDAEASMAGQGRPKAVAVTPDGQVAFSGSTRGVLTRFDVSMEAADQRRVRSRDVATYTLEGGPWKDARLSFSGDWVGSVAVLDVTKEPPQEYDWPWTTGITQLGVTPDGRRLAWATTDLCVIVWEGTDRSPRIASWRGGTWITSVAATPNGLVIATRRDGGVSCGDLEQDEWWHWEDPDLRPDRVRCAAAVDERWRVLGTRDGNLFVEGRDVGLFQMPIHPDGIDAVALAYTPDGAIIVTGDPNGSIGVLQPTGDPNGRVGVFQPSPTGEVRIEAKIRIGGGGVPVKLVAMSPDGKFAVSGSTDDDLTLWRLPELTKVAHFHCDGEIEDVALAANASLVVVADGAGGVHLLTTMRGHEAP